MTSGWGNCWALSDRNVECSLKLLVSCVASQLTRVYEWSSPKRVEVFPTYGFFFFLAPKIA